MSRCIKFFRFRLLQFASLAVVASQSVAQVTPLQSSSNDLQTFQVATIKPSKPDEATSIQVRGRRLLTTGTSLVDLLKYAYGLHLSQIIGGPEWTRTEKFDLLADPETENMPSSDAMKQMVQRLLADRLKLVSHPSQRDLPAYELLITKDSSKLTQSTKDPNGIPAWSYTPGWLTVSNASMVDFASFLQRSVSDRPVVDRTGVKGRYDLTLRWATDEPERTLKKEEAAFPGFFTAIQEQVGLKLFPVKTSITVLVIESIERPSEN